VTTDEELNHLDTQLRRLKIEYEIFFSNPSKRPPADIEWKVLALLRKFSDGGRMNFSQRYRYNEMAQRYAIYSDLWRKKCRIREEGYRRPQDALLSVQGVRTGEEDHKQQHHPVYGVSHAATAAAAGNKASQPLTLHSVDPSEKEQVERLQHAGRGQEESGRKRYGHDRLFHRVRAEEDGADSQAISLRRRRVLRRTGRRSREAEGQSQDLVDIHSFLPEAAGLPRRFLFYQPTALDP